MEFFKKKDIVRFPSPIVYNNRLEKIILGLSNAILSDKDEALCSELLLSLADSLTQTNPCRSYKKDNALIIKAKDMICCNLKNVFKLDDICKELDMSKYKFIRLFKANTGISPYQYFLNIKIDYARKLIEKNRDVYLAVEECGFVDLTHLNKNFKSIYGITPFEYMSHLN